MYLLYIAIIIAGGITMGNSLVAEKIKPIVSLLIVLLPTMFAVIALTDNAMCENVLKHMFFLYIAVTYLYIQIRSWVLWEPSDDGWFGTIGEIVTALSKLVLFGIFLSSVVLFNMSTMVIYNNSCNMLQ